MPCLLKNVVYCIKRFAFNPYMSTLQLYAKVHCILTPPTTFIRKSMVFLQNMFVVLINSHFESHCGPKISSGLKLAQFLNWKMKYKWKSHKVICTAKCDHYTLHVAIIVKHNKNGKFCAETWMIGNRNQTQHTGIKQCTQCLHCVPVLDCVSTPVK